jgi:CHC2-type zinc finger protein
MKERISKNAHGETVPATETVGVFRDLLLSALSREKRACRRAAWITGLRKRKFPRSEFLGAVFVFRCPPSCARLSDSRSKRQLDELAAKRKTRRNLAGVTGPKTTNSRVSRAPSAASAIRVVVLDHRTTQSTAARSDRQREDRAMTRDEVIAANPIADFVRNRGHALMRAGENFVTSGCPVTQHKPSHRPVMIYSKTQSWSCHDCKVGGSVIDWLAKEKGISGADAMRELAGGRNGSEPAARLVKTYDYTDECGELLYQVCRYDPKDFKQRRPDGRSGWVWSTVNVRRVVYRLPEVIAAQMVIVTEGEKDADNLAGLGFVATCNCGGR